MQAILEPMYGLLFSSLLSLLPTPWKPLAPGVEYRVMILGPAQAQVVRFDPERTLLKFGLSSKSKGPSQTAAQWASQQGLMVVINAGMFQTDGRSNVGYLVDGDHINHRSYNGYLSALVFSPKEKGLPRAQILDLDEPGAKALAAQYRSVVQNLRLIKAPGINVWKKNGRAWSEAAIGQDKQGRLLFIFTRQGVEMAIWNDLLLRSELGVVRAMHVEGGPEASLSIHTKELALDFCGSFETGFHPDEGNLDQWPLPNVVGLVSE